MLLVANRGSKQLVALYFTQQPPGMEAQTFPVALPPSGAQHGKAALAEPLQFSERPALCSHALAWTALRSVWGFGGLL